MRANDWNEVPLFLQVSDIAKLFGISRAQAYELAHARGRKVGRRFLVPKDAAREFLMEGPKEAA